MKRDCQPVWQWSSHHKIYAVGLVHGTAWQMKLSPTCDVGISYKAKTQMR